MPDVAQILPDALKPWTFHGFDLSYREGDKEARGTCPFCGREGKLYVNAESGQWNCRKCNEGGNVFTLLRRLWEERGQSDNALSLLAERKRVSVEAMVAWGAGVGFVAPEDIFVPGFDAGGQVMQLYRWTYNPGDDRFYWNMPKGLKHALLGVHLFDRNKRDVYLCEGFWDAVALWETLRSLRRTENGVYLPTDDESDSLLANANVLAIPTATTFNEHWAELFSGCRVFLCLDSDHPDKMGRVSGLEGTKHAVSVLALADDPPEEMQWLVWGEGGYDKELKSGYDVRDLLTSGDEEDRNMGLERLFHSLEPVPADWINAAKKKGKPCLEPIECRDWATVEKACQKGFTFTEGHNRGLSCMFACAASVDIGGAQLWMQFIGPPSCGKTSLGEGLLIARKECVSRSVLKGFHSGWKTEDGKDHSVMAAIKGKAVITKDGDSLLNAENKAVIMSEARDGYDRSSVYQGRNGVLHEYLDHSWVWMIYGTSAMRELDASELGQRFVHCVIMEGVDKKVERAINDGRMTAFEALMANQASANGDGTDGPERTFAKRVIGGYMIYLRRNMKYLVSQVRNTDEAREEIKLLAEFVALFRARPSTTQNEDVTRELSTRLLEQLGKLAYCLAAVLGKRVIDKEVMRRVRQCAFDTCRGKTVRLAKAVFRAGPRGASAQALSIECNLDLREIKSLLIFLKTIDVLEPIVEKKKVGVGAAGLKWRLTKDATTLYKKLLT